MNSERNRAKVVGILFITATVAAVISGIFLGPIIDAPDYLLEVATHEQEVVLGAIFYFIMAAAGASITIPMYPVLKKYNESLALGSVVFRAIEGMLFMTGVICLLLLIPLSQEYVGAGAPANSYFQTLGQILLQAGVITAGDQYKNIGVFAFSLGALMYYYIFYHSHLIPRWLSIWGLVGISLGLVDAFLTIFDIYSVSSSISLLMDLPIFVQEMVMAVWLIFKGFNDTNFS